MNRNMMKNLDGEYNGTEVSNGTMISQMAEEAGAAGIRSLDEAQTLCQAIAAHCRTRVQGRDDVIDLVLTALFADGHVLLEDHPGSGKTTLAKALGECIVRRTLDTQLAAYRRIQFTPDTLPSDVTGVTVFDTQTSAFSFKPGPLFANVVLADEINRTSPKVQAALLEAMAEKQVTVDNQTHPLEDLFFVIATQNPLDLVGTYPLPKAQLDRFLFKIQMTYLDKQSELEVLARRQTACTSPAQVAVAPTVIRAARLMIQQTVRVHPLIHECLVDIAQAIRKDSRVVLGISTRSLVLAIPALQVWAMMQGRDFVSPKDVKTLALFLFPHRLDLVPGVKDAAGVVMECVTPVVEAITRRTLAA